MTPTPRPTGITLHRASHVLEVAFDSGEAFRLPCEYLRTHSPSAEVQGHGPGQRVLQHGKRNVNVAEIVPVGHYGVLLKFDSAAPPAPFKLPRTSCTISAATRNATGLLIWQRWRKPD